ncbi:MAG TPA: hypothetical protein VD995_28030 [Azospirillum sp.]|nr:hypothetical protein [Azospirillum sp.]
MENDISFAEILLRRGTDLLQGDEDGDDESETVVDFLARLLATVALTDGPLVVQTEAGGDPTIFEEAARVAMGSLADKATVLAATRQVERAVVFEFDGVGRLSGSRVITAVLRPEDRNDLLEAYVAVGRLRNATLEMTVAPATVRLDAGALGQTLELLGSAASLSANAIGAAMAHASGTHALEGHDVSEVPAAMVDLCWHGFCLASVRSRGTAGYGMNGKVTLH